MKKIIKNKHFILFLILSTSFIARLLLLNKIPAEMWGDTNSHFQFAANILKGNFVKEFWLGDGPIFSYFAALVFKIFGQSFFSLKLTTVLSGVLSTYLMYLFAKQLSKNNLIAYISAFLMSVSFWSISFSRQGKPYILVCLFVLLVTYLALRKKWLLAGLFLGIGMYSQAAFWEFILFGFINLQMLAVSLLVSGPLIFQIVFSKTNYFNNATSYLGEKFAFGIDWPKKIFIILENFYKNTTALWTHGDVSFRNNISLHSHLDAISGIFFIIGLIFVFKEIILKKNKSFIMFLILPFFLSQAASIFDVNNPLNTPSMGRTIGMTPFIYFIISYAIYKIYNFLFKKNNNVISSAFLIISLAIICFINIYNYFIIYPKGLPDKNTPFGYIIAQDIEKEQSSAKIFLVGCCWGEWGHPEIDSIQDRITTNKHLDYVLKDDFINNTCQELVGNAKKELVIYTDPTDKNLISKISKCFKKYNLSIIRSNGFNVAAKFNGLIK